MYRIRFHGRGGQGIKTAGRILGTAFFREGFEVQDAPLYGAERRGAPMFAYVRAARAPIFERGVIAEPDLVIVADDTLVPVAAAGVLKGASARSVILLNTRESAATWKARLNYPGKVIAIDAWSADDSAEEGYIGATCAGAAARLVGVVSRKSLEDAIRQEVAGFGEEIVAENERRALAAFDGMAADTGCVSEGAEPHAEDYRNPEWVDLPLEGVGLSAPAIHRPATSVEIRTGLWRSMRPVIDYDRCNRCSWICGTFCPDSAISVKPDGHPEIDYDHCKGCLICVAVCPPHAISAVPEHSAAGAGDTGAKTGTAPVRKP
jgi:pyruvate ferredoxin oxidoreductase gamma subunit